MNEQITADTPVGEKFLMASQREGGAAYSLTLVANDGKRLSFEDDGGFPQEMSIETWRAEWASRVVGAQGGSPAEDEPSGAAEAAGTVPGAEEPDEAGGPTESQAEGTTEPTPCRTEAAGSLAEVLQRHNVACVWLGRARRDAELSAVMAKTSKLAFKQAQEQMNAVSEELRVATGDCPDLPLFHAPERGADAEPVPEPSLVADADEAVAEYEGLGVGSAGETALADIPDMPASSTNLLASQGITTLGDLHALAVGAGDKPWWEGVVGMGAAKAKKVEAAWEAFTSGSGKN